MNATSHDNLKHSALAQTFYPWIIWGLGCLFYFYEFFLQVSPSVMVPELMRDFSVTATQLGILGSIYFYSYVIMQVPVGLLLDRFGPRKLLTLASIVCAAGSFLFGITHHFFIAEVARFMIGFGSAFALVGCFKIAADWFPSDRFALLAGLVITLGMSGAIVGESPLAFLIAKIHWRDSMVLFGFIGIIISFLLLFIMKEHPHESPNQETTNVTKHFSLWQSLKDFFSSIIVGFLVFLIAICIAVGGIFGQSKKVQEFLLNMTHSMGHNMQPILENFLKIITKKQIWLGALYGGLVYTSTPAFTGLWGVPFLTQKYNIERPEAAAMVSIIFVGWLIGSPLFGWLSDRLRRRLPPMIIAAIGGLVSISTILYVSGISIWLMNILLFAFGFFSSGFLPVFSLVRELSPKRSSGTAVAFTNMLNMLGVPITHTIIGILLDLTWHGQMADGIPVYTLHDYNIALCVFPITFILAIIILPFIKETYCRIVDDNE
ncbi:MAG: MFS transporter [Proteobacteria bacterium]|nr:MFS transporter [Pseudomonadota bacterium]